MPDRVTRLLDNRQLTTDDIMRLIPVIDVKNGLVVRGVGGRRDEYQPIVSCLTASAEPLTVVRALIEAVHPAEIYIADLNAIKGDVPAWAIYRDLRTLGVPLWVDAGVRLVDDAVKLAEAGIAGVICGLETLTGPTTLVQIVERLGAKRVIFSLDLKNGRLLGNIAAWSLAPDEPVALAGKICAMGVRQLIVLDLAAVGEGSGVATLDLCRTISTNFPGLQIYAGGGVRGHDDLARLSAAGVAGALVASALHAGRIKSIHPAKT